MKKNLLTTIFLISTFAKINAQTIDCIIVKKGEQLLIKEGENCNTAYSPNSTFKIPLAVMGFESSVLKTAHNPVWKPQKPVTYLKQYHNHEQSPSSWMRFSVVWYSQILTQKLGMKTFQNYVNKFNYGNKNLSGDEGKNNGLTDSWISSSLTITPFEQIAFIEKLAKNELPVSQKAQEKTKDLTKLVEESLHTNGWSLYGKTGAADFDKTNKKEGYFIGFAKKNEDIISFVMHTSGVIGDKSEKIGGVFAKKLLIDRMIKEDIFK